jgi:phage-related protein
MSTNVGAVDFELLLNSNPFNKGLKSATNTIKSSGIENSLKKIGKLAIAAFSVKAIVNFGKECINLGSDLAEVQNVVDVTFGNLNTEVNQFAENAITQFGLGQTVTKKYVGTFGAMAKAFDFSNESALAMSETLTGLTGDVASFYNLSSDEAYTKLKSVFTGETESLKDLGVVMTQNALDQYALANGYEKTTSQMSEQEKVALRYKFVLDKLNIASGDFARTSDSWANQTRVLSLRFNELKATLGQGFINIFTPIVKGINWVLAKLQVLANAFKSFTEMIFGKAGGDDNTNTVNNLASSATKASDAVSGIGDSAKKSAKDLKSLAAFDTAQVLKKEDSDSSSSGGSGAGGNIDTSGLNLTDNLKKQAGDIGKIFSDINFEPLINSFNKVKDAAQPLITTIKDGLRWLYDNVLIPLSKWTIENLLPAFLNLLSGALKVLNPLITAFKPIFEWFWNNFLEPIAKWTGGIIIDTLNLLANALTRIGNWMSENQSVVTGMEIAVLGFFSAWKVVELISFIQQVGGVIVALELLKNAILGNIIAKITDKAETVALTLMYAKDFIISIASGTAALVKQAAQWVVNTALKIANTAATIAHTVATGAATAATWLFNAALTVLTSPITLVIVAIAALCAGIYLLIKNWDKVKEVAAKCWEGIKNTFSNVGQWFSNKFQQAYTGITNVFSNIGNFFSGIWERIKNTFSNLGTSIGNAISNAVKTGINGVISLVERTINRAINLINGAIGIINLIPGVSVGKIGSLNLPRLAQGGYVKANTPQLAMIGDNRHQGEVVAPEDKLMSLYKKANQEMGLGNNEKVIELLERIIQILINLSLNFNLYIDGYELNKRLEKIKNKNKFATNGG